MHKGSDALDLLIVCVESGLGLAAALHRVSLELKISWPDLASELLGQELFHLEVVGDKLRAAEVARREGQRDLTSLRRPAFRFGRRVSVTSPS